MFDEMIERIQSRTIEMLLRAKVEAAPRRPTPRIYPSAPVRPAPVPAPDAPAQTPAQPAPTGPVANPATVRPEDMPLAGVDAPAHVDVAALKTSGNEKFNPATIKKAKKVGPNDPCPCGSGLKYKKCHGKPF